MKESAIIALEYIKSHAEELGLDADELNKRNVHLHVPQGAIPKDGPSAGITMVSAMVSAFTRRKIRKAVAMTGEITLRGQVLPVGGIRKNPCRETRRNQRSSSASATAKTLTKSTRATSKDSLSPSFRTSWR